MSEGYHVYMHTSPSGKRYIGITSEKNPQKRWGRDGCKYDSLRFGGAVKKYGWDNIKHEILFSGLSKDEAVAKEVELIGQYKTMNRKYGYNASPGGNYASPAKKLRLAQIRRNMRGEKHPCNKSVCKIDRNTGEVLCVYPSMEIAAADVGTYGTSISKCVRFKRGCVAGYLWCCEEDYTQSFFDKYKDVEWVFNGRGWYDAKEMHKPRSEEAKNRMRGTGGKQVVCVETGEVFNTAQEAATKYGISNSSIGKCCAGKAISCGGYHWTFADNPMPQPTSNRDIRIEQIDISTGKVIAVFPSILEAKRQTGVDSRTIRESAQGITKRKYGSNQYLWRYV